MDSASWERVLELSSRYGYPFLFAVAAAENTFLLGLVVPGDVAVVLGGALSAAGSLHPIVVTIVVTIGAIAGSILSFRIGRRGGPPLVERSFVRFGVDPTSLQKVERYFAAHGAKTVFLGCFVSGLKNFVPAIAGASRMNPGRFVAYNAAGGAARSILLVGFGYIFGANLPRAIDAVRSFNVWVVGAILALLAGLLAFGWLKRRRAARESGETGANRVDRGAS